MNMQINIKSVQARELADEITKRTGETITEAVTAALKERLRQLTIDDRKSAVRKIVEDLRCEWKEPLKSMDHAELLYDENGMPK